MQTDSATLDTLKERLRAAAFSAGDISLITKAAEDAAPGGLEIGAAIILTALGLDAECVICELVRNEEGEHIKNAWGEKIASIVEDVKKVELMSLHSASGVESKTNLETENIRKMLFAMINDIRVLFIILAEKLQRLRSFTKDEPEKLRKSFAEECLVLYAPLADRFGVSWLKDEIEDLSLKNINPVVFLQIKDIVALKINKRQAVLDFIKKTVEDEAAALGLKVEVQARAKHFYSIYQKMRKRKKQASEIYDLFGVRILCEGIADCYTVLGLVHRLWKPLEGRFKDYIAMPKANGYQSLHTTVMTDFDLGGQENYIEVQIRTFEMHNIAEHGIASHWLYKRGSGKEIVNEDYLPVVNKLKNFLKESSHSFLDEMKKEILRDSIFVFTPRGKVVELPEGSTALDFAYSIHSDIGSHCYLAKANGKVISLSAPLENTQVIEIITSAAAKPHTSWLNIVKTAKARNKIRQALALVSSDAAPDKQDKQEKQDKNAEKGASSRSGENSAGSAKTAVKEAVKGAFGKVKSAAGINVLVQNQKNMLVRFAKCCEPKAGDDIVGFISRGRGIIIHKKDCRSLSYIKDFEDREINVDWDYAEK